jgi:hypothetical protein
MSPVGPTRKWLSVPTTSALWGTPDSLCSPRTFPSLTPLRKFSRCGARSIEAWNSSLHPRECPTVAYLVMLPIGEQDEIEQARLLVAPCGAALAVRATILAKLEQRVLRAICLADGYELFAAKRTEAPPAIGMAIEQE